MGRPFVYPAGMWVLFIVAWTALALLIAAPFETIGAALGGYVGFLIGYQTGQGLASWRG